MCGIFAWLAQQKDGIPSDQRVAAVKQYFQQIKHRGPDHHSWIQPQSGLTFGFHRLAINGLDFGSNMPLRYRHCWLICNGEIYNCRELQQCYGFEYQTHNDCEVIMHLYYLMGFKEAVRQLDGVFSIMLYDEEYGKLHVANDPLGIRPLYWAAPIAPFRYLKQARKQLQKQQKSNTTAGATATTPIELAWASEPKALTFLDRIEFFPPGCFLIMQLDRETGQMSGPAYWDRYYHYQWPINYFRPTEQIHSDLRQLLTQAVQKRLMSDRGVASLLSGGLDSSLISGLLAQLLKVQGKQLHTFSIGLPGSPDLKYAQEVADHIGSHHHSIQVTEQDFLAAIPNTIRAIQSYDITTVRASVGNFLIGRAIQAYNKEHETDFTVIFNGDVSEEINASYFYSSHAPEPWAYHKDNRKLLREVHLYDVLRSARSMEAHSLEARTPFADKFLVNYVMSIDPSLKMFGGKAEKYAPIEKHLLREAFRGTNLIPESVINRKKTAFSDGVSTQKRSWHQVIDEHVNQLISDDDWSKVQKSEKFSSDNNPPPTKEAYYYRKLFELSLPGQGHLVPEYWMPRFITASDPSARELDNYLEHE